MNSSPTCPACGSKFSRDKDTQRCRNCGLPEFVANAGPSAIAQWKRGGTTLEQQPTREFKTGRAARLSRRRNKHGRKGVKR